MTDAFDVLFDYVTHGSPNSAEHTRRYVGRYPQFRDEIIELAAVWRALSIIEAVLPPPEPNLVGDRRILWRAQVEFRAGRRGRAKVHAEAPAVAKTLRLVDEQGRRFAVISKE
jgi:hypothetical protein